MSRRKPSLNKDRACGSAGVACIVHVRYASWFRSAHHLHRALLRRRTHFPTELLTELKNRRWNLSIVTNDWNKFGNYGIWDAAFFSLRFLFIGLFDRLFDNYIMGCMMKIIKSRASEILNCYYRNKCSNMFWFFLQYNNF